VAKTRTVFFCQNCGAQSPKWIGKCPSCGEWNTYVEETIQPKSEVAAWKSPSAGKQKSPRAQLLSAISVTDEHRIKIDDNELQRVLGGGLVPGSIILFGGEPGIGKSTLLLQLALRFADCKVLYVSGEESEQQIKLRANRIGSMNKELLILTETSLENIFIQIAETNPDFLIIDSIQTVFTSRIESSPGSVSQIRECASELLRYAKESSTPVFLIGHITKEGTIAGPKVLEHMVDTVLQFEGDRNHMYRILRATKNRFGSTAEIGIYEMNGDGLREVSNPSEVLISQRDEKLSGTSIAVTMEGIRPLLIEVQALVSSAVYGTPQRSSTGFDLRRLSMLLAVLEKRCGFNLGTKDVFLNIAGGIRVEDPAIDLAVICSVLSSNEDLPIDPKICLAAEVGLNGEIRPVTRVEQRISEAEKMGFSQILISRYNLKGLEKLKKKIEIRPVARVEDVFALLFG
jgi:DNA repair protein RadA/Sms